MKCGRQAGVPPTPGPLGELAATGRPARPAWEALARSQLARARPRLQAGPGPAERRLPDPGARGAPSLDTSRGAQGPGGRDAGSERAGGRGPRRGPPTLYHSRLPLGPRPDSAYQREALRPRGWPVGGRGGGEGARGGK